MLRHVTIEFTAGDRAGQRDAITYDYLINATGPRLNFGATPGLGPGATVSLRLYLQPRGPHRISAGRRR